MFWKEIGGILIFLLVFVIFANIWFHFVESILTAIKKIFCCHKEPPAWHPLPQEDAREDEEDI